MFWAFLLARRRYLERPDARTDSHVLRLKTREDMVRLVRDTRQRELAHRRTIILEVC